MVCLTYFSYHTIEANSKRLWKQKWHYPSCILALLVVSGTTQARSLDHIKYGERIFIESGARDRGEIWLSGSRNSGNRDVLTRSALANNELDNRSAYEWKILSAPGTGVPFDGKNDPRQGQCVRYGDVVYILNLTRSGKWLSGSRSGGNSAVFTSNLLAETNKVTTYKWEIRSEFGSGALNDAERPDPGFGECIYDFSSVIFQNQFRSNRWLNGDRGGVGGVRTYNYYDSDSGKGKSGMYRWVLSNTLSYPGITDKPIRCAASAASGSWVKLSYTNGEQELIYSVGVERTSGSSFTQTSSWETTVTSTVSAGFSVGGIGGGAELSVSASLGGSMEHSVSRSVSHSTVEDKVYSFDKPGRLWQWQYNVHDICQAHPWTLKTYDVVTTDNDAHPPCCLPGYAADASAQHGACLEDSPCICSPAQCEAIKNPPTDSEPNASALTEMCDALLRFC